MDDASRKLEDGYSGLVSAGPAPSGALPRWGRWVQAPPEGLPPVPVYACHRNRMPLIVDGALDEPAWDTAIWSEPFGGIATGEPAPLETRVALLWDERGLRAGFRVEDHDIRATMSGFHDHVYLRDEDVELFIAGDGFYYELGVNAINTAYEIRWTWVQPAVERRDWAELERMLATPNYLYFMARDGEPIGRHGDLDWELPGLEHAVRVDGTLNCPEVKDRAWTVEIAIPWEGLRPLMGTRQLPPLPGDEWRIGAYRAHHVRDARPGENTPVGWSWSATGNDNIHVPERWARVTFVNEALEG
jgi:hypothetical protein